MIFSLIKNSEWGYLLDFVSPSFFKVMPTRALASQVKELVANAVKKKDFSDFMNHMSFLENQKDIQISFDPKSQTQNDFKDLKNLQKKKIGETLLKIYFSQIFTSQKVCLDLRLQGMNFDLSTNHTNMTWNPARLWCEWDEDFLKSLRKLYSGFYFDKMKDFDEALKELNLFSAKNLFLQHFGSDQNEIAFRIKDFISTFHKVFLNCKKNHVRLHKNFLCLGIYIATLYESLEFLNQRFDVKKCFNEVI